MNILIAEKSFEIREQLKRLVSSVYKGISFHETDSNLEAICKLFKYYPGLVITDVDLKDGTGLGLISFAASMQPKAQVIVYTQNNIKEVKDTCFKIGIDHYIIKSSDMIKMKEILIQSENKVKFYIPKRNINVFTKPKFSFN